VLLRCATCDVAMIRPGRQVCSTGWACGKKFCSVITLIEGTRVVAACGVPIDSIILRSSLNIHSHENNMEQETYNGGCVRSMGLPSL
jgi:hypothetical protein